MIDHEEVYRFYLGIDEAPSRRVVPIWGNSHSRDRKREDGRRIVRDSITQGFIFTPGEGYEEILDGSIENTYYLTINEIVDGEEVLYFPGEFNRTDCKFDLDSGKIEASLRVNDQNAEFLEQEDTEFDLIKLGTPESPVSFKVFASLQVYAAGSQQVGVLYDGNYFPRNVEAITDQRTGRDSEGNVIDPVSASDILVNDLNFSNPTEVFFIPYRDDYPVDISGQYFPNDPDNLTSRRFRRADGLFIWRLDDSGQNMYVEDSAGNTVAARRLRPGTDFFGPLVFIGSDPVVTATISRIDVFGRFNIPDGMDWPGNPDNLRGPVEGDQFAPEGTTAQTAPYQLAVVPSVAFSDTDYGYGRFTNTGNYPNSGEFILPPAANQADIFYYPIGRDLWTNVSFWALYDLGTELLVENSAITRVISSAFTLSDSINRLLEEIDPNLSFDGTTTNSEFLFGDVNPLTGNAPFEYVVVPKSNILVKSYDKPAGRAPIKFSDVTQLLRFCFQGEAVIESDGVFKIETERWFENGQTYDDAEPLLGIDLTALIERHTERPWAYFTDNFEFDKERLPERIVFGWMDEVTDPFEGDDLVMLSKYVQRGQKEERRVSFFSTDLQLAVNLPGSFTNSGFFLLACERDEEGNLFVAKTDVPGFGSIQNGALSWPYLQAVYYRDNLPARRYLVNGEEETARSTRPTKKQTVRTPVPPNLSPLKLARTNLGSGLPDSINENMVSKVASINISYGTD